MLKILFTALAALLFAGHAAAQNSRGFDDSASNLMVVLRESQGQSRAEDSLMPFGKGKVKLQDGKEVEVDPGWFTYIGDLHIRFVFDTPTSMPGASPQDLERLRLTPEAAVALAVRNIKRVYGEPTVKAWDDWLQVESKSPDLISSYFLDKDFWRAQLKRYPEGVVAMLPKRGALVFAPLADTKAIESMKRSVAALFISSKQLRVSSALYLFKDDHWTLFQQPVGAPKQT